MHPAGENYARVLTFWLSDCMKRAIERAGGCMNLFYDIKQQGQPESLSGKSADILKGHSWISVMTSKRRAGSDLISILAVGIDRWLFAAIVCMDTQSSRQCEALLTDRRAPSLYHLASLRGTRLQGVENLCVACSLALDVRF